MGEDKKIDGKFKNNAITDIVEIISLKCIYIYIYTYKYICNNKSTVWRFSDRKFWNSTSEEYCTRKFVKGLLYKEDYKMNVSGKKYLPQISFCIFQFFVYMSSYHSPLNNIY